MQSTGKGWIGVDLDGTLAYHESRMGMDRVGRLLAPMAERIRYWLDEAVEVRIFTARASVPGLSTVVSAWLQTEALPDLPVTHRKDFDLLQLWDDRAVQLESNTAAVLTPKQFINLLPTGWIGVELDGTLALADSPQNLDRIGAPVPAMLNRVKQWAMLGLDVRVFTARALDPAQVGMIQQWLQAHGLPALPVTCEKDFQMSQYYDDRAVHVISNQGVPSVDMAFAAPARRYAI